MRHDRFLPSTRTFGALAVCLFAALGPASSARAEDPALALFREGIEAINENNVPLAYEKFRASWSIRQTFDIAANLGAVEKAMGKKRDAAEHLDYALRHFPPTNSTDQRAEIAKDLEELKKDVGELHIQSATGATVEINGKPVGICPLPGPIFVEPGQQIIVAKKSEIGEGKIVVMVSVGEAQEVRVELTLEPKTGPVEPKPTPRPMWPGFVGVGVGAAGIGVGIAGLVLSFQAQDDADVLADELSPGACGNNNATCEDLQSKLDDVATFRTMGIAGMVVGGAATIFGVVYLAIPNPGGDEDEEATVKAAKLTPWIGPGTGGLVMSGKF